MKPPIKTYKQFDVVIVPFPFTDRQAAKRRPALVVSDENEFNHSLVIRKSGVLSLTDQANVRDALRRLTALH
jgi:hypothetical protein